VLSELEYRLLLCYMAQTRTSAKIIDRQVTSLQGGARGDVERAAPAQGRDARDEEGAAARQHRRDRRAAAARAWEHKKQLDKEISNTHVDKLYQLARKEGAIGGKMPGAGGGGYFLLLTRFDRKPPGGARVSTSTAARWCRSSSSAAAC
jgi:D-glycero-alpha-D-manno-heptose-7-phosphate kinase